VQIFFPDPWPKRRHHQRRLIQSDFIKLVVDRLKEGGVLHLATDWDDYAQHMLQVVTLETQLVNLAGVGQFSAERSTQRPIVTKFENRAIREGRGIWELQLVKGKI
jgi:tRNA (guanine-N7-)-methyltransferase